MRRTSVAAATCFCLLFFLLPSGTGAQGAPTFPLVPIGTLVGCPKPPPCEKPREWDEEYQVWIPAEPPGCGRTGEMEVAAVVLPWQHIVREEEDATIHFAPLYMQCLNCEDTEEPNEGLFGLLGLLGLTQTGRNCVAGYNVIVIPEPMMGLMLPPGALLLVLLARRKQRQ